MQSYNYDAIKYRGDTSNKISESLVVEAALQININDEPYTVVMRTPGDDEYLVRGLLYAEDIYKRSEDLQLEVVEQKENGFAIINAEIPKEKLGKGYMNKRTLLSVSSCGICGKQELSDIEISGPSIEHERKVSLRAIKAMYADMKSTQLLFEKTGGSHATAAFDNHGTMLSLKEDIGRHNALDKVVGELLNTKKLQEAICVLVSGRISYEIVSKAFIAKIPTIVAVSACSSLAVDFAKELGLCVIGFNRGDKATVYANPNYIKK
ncbi:MAG: formate dehydrogenase accessory sulfurtransferase FdhD [Flavobacteriaceae bacterium]|nr:formate dehydrogenase accessory sulfurtransferase FdhD [Flavobacteriaceae bacterium]